MSNKERIRITVVTADGRRQELSGQVGTPLFNVIRQLGREGEQRYEYRVLRSGEVISPATILTEDLDCIEVAASVVAGGQIDVFEDPVPYSARFKGFWKRSFRDLMLNLTLAWPVFAFLIVAATLSTLLLEHFEGMKLSQGLYL